MERDELRAWFVLSASGLTALRQRLLLEAFGGPVAVLAASDRELSATEGINALHVRKLREAQAGPLADEGERAMAEMGASLVPITAEAYPPALRETQDPPPLLVVEGNLLAGDEAAVAIVGTRKCTPYGRQVARRIAYDLAARGITVVSGMALGIDGEAHQGALEVGGRTVAVLGCGLDVTYPRQHEELRGRIAASGAVVSELPFGTQPSREQFPRRNRIISGLSKGVVVVEAPAGSGALITARFAGEHGRDVFAVPGDVTRPESTGCNDLIRDGATLIRSAEDVLESLSFSLEFRVEQRQRDDRAANLPPDEASVHEALGTEARTVDDVVATSGLDAGKVMSALMMLEIKGLVRRFGGGTYARADV